MARTSAVVRPPPDYRDAAQDPPTPLDSSGDFALVGTVAVSGLAPHGTELLLMPRGYEDREDVGNDAEWRREHDASRCWKTTFIYQQIEHHPHLVRFIRADPWTYLPVVAQPKGPPLRKFIEEHRGAMYEQRASSRTTANSRIKSTYQQLAYQWALQLASALEFIHGHSRELPAPKISIVVGDFSIENCWLTLPGFHLSLLGFLDAGFRTRSGPLHLGDASSGEPFHPLYNLTGQAAQPTLQTDIFLWGCVTYELMTGYWPGSGQGLSDQETSMLVACKEWPTLESQYLGEIVHMCWEGEVKDSAELLEKVRATIVESGSVVENDDEIVNLDIDLTTPTTLKEVALG